MATRNNINWNKFVSHISWAIFLLYNLKRIRRKRIIIKKFKK